MVSFPIIYPKSSGPGRLMEICSFRRSGIPISRYDEVLNGIQEIASNFPIARQSLLGAKTANKQITVMIADWTSAAEKDEFEPGERYQSIKPAFGELVDAENHEFACHHIILPLGDKATPEAGSYIFSFTNVAAENQGRLAKTLEEHVTSVFQSKRPVFFVAAPSREDANVVVGVWGWKSEQEGSEYFGGEEHKKFLEETKTLVTGDVTEYQAGLTKWRAAAEGGWRTV